MSRTDHEGQLASTVGQRLWRVLIPLCVLIAILVVATPAQAYKGWQHATAIGKRSCAVGCHAEQAPTNTTCSACHSGFATSGSQWCWTCHEPGQPTSAWQLATGCVSTCHLWTSSSESPDYTAAYAHTTSVHLGASGYGATCVDCHGVSAGAAAPGTSPHHDAVDSAAPDCAGCHDGIIASAPTGHDVFGADCAACHTGMDRPSGDCAACHIGRTDTTIPQITYANTLACADAACHGAVAVHVDVPISAKPCITCHAAHYEALGACATCHPDPQTFHHEAASARPLADCAGCHDGIIASAKASHSTVACFMCHSGMARPPVPAVCSQCHFARKFGTATCTSCHSATGMMGREQVHAATPRAGVSCSTCHDAHYADLGACTACHGRVPEAHHGVIAPASSVLSVQASPSRLTAGAAAVVSGTLTDSGGAPLAGLEVLLQARRLTQTAFTDVATLTTGTDGSFSRPVQPVAGTEYRAIFRGASSAASVRSPAIMRAPVTVKQAVRLTARRATVRHGATVKFSGAVAPTPQQLGAASSAVTLRVEHGTLSGWRRVARRVLTPRADGTYSWSWRTRKAGAYRATATAAATPALLAGTSSRITIRVR